MPRGRAGRQPTIDELTRDQRRIYDAIPVEDVQHLYLSSLPPIRETPASRRQVEKLRRRMQILGALQRYTQVETERLTTLVAEAERGRKLDLEEQFTTPDIGGVTIRFAQRFRREPSAAAPAAAPARPAVSRAGAAKRTAASKPAPANDSEAPYGRDLEGTPYAPWGRKKDGTPARPKGPSSRAEEQIDNFIARRASNPALTAEEVEP